MDVIERANQLERDLYALSYCTRKIIELNQKLEVIEYQKKNVHAVKYDQIKFHSNYRFHDDLIDQIEKEDMIKREICFYIRRINECDFLDAIDSMDRKIILDRYVFKMNVFDMCEEYGYTRQGMRKHIRGILENVQKKRAWEITLRV